MERSKRPAVIAEAGIFVMAALILALYFYADSRMLTMDTGESGAARLSKHYAFISEDTSDLWETVFGAAAEQARDNSAYLEWIGREAPVDYDVADCLRIATASGVDGIILHKAAGEDMTALIDRAQDAGIPVITVFEDESGSERVSYVGMNNYQLGEMYARQVLDCLREGENHVLVISGSPLGEGGLGLMYSQMLQTTEQGRARGQTVSFEAMEVSGSTSFDAEEAIRDVLVSGSALPDIIVCLDLTITECVSQALVDYNEVGNVSVIGFYASETVSEAISRGIVYATLGIDAAQIGQVSVDALDEYWRLGRVSNYFNVGMSVINAQTIRAARSEDGE